MAQPRSLDDILLTIPAAAAWHEMCRKAAPIIGPLIASGAHIPDEECEEVEGGALRIFVKMPGGIEISMIVPPGQWAFRPEINN